MRCRDVIELSTDQTKLPCQSENEKRMTSENSYAKVNTAQCTFRLLIPHTKVCKRASVYDVALL